MATEHPVAIKDSKFTCYDFVQDAPQFWSSCKPKTQSCTLVYIHIYIYIYTHTHSTLVSNLGDPELPT